MCVGYNTDPLLIFLIHDISLARSTIMTLQLAEQRGLTADTLADCSQISDSYWEHEQDYLCDIVRQMAKRCAEPGDDQHLLAYCSQAQGR